MPSRVFFGRGYTNFIAGYSAATKSAALPVGTLNDPADRFLDFLPCNGGDSVLPAFPTMNTLAQTADQDGLYGKWISDRLRVQTIDAATWSIGMGTNESNAAANAFLCLSVYVLTSGDTVRGYIWDSHTTIGSEWGSATVVNTFSGSAVSSIVSTDRLVCEVWWHATQAMATTYTVAFLHGCGSLGTGGAITASGGENSWLETPQSGLFWQPHNVGANFQDPGVLSKARDLWERTRSGISVPRLWTPEGATI